MRWSTVLLAASALERRLKETYLVPRRMLLRCLLDTNHVATKRVCR